MFHAEIWPENLIFHYGWLAVANPEALPNQVTLKWPPLPKRYWSTQRPQVESGCIYPAEFGSSSGNLELEKGPCFWQQIWKPSKPNRLKWVHWRSLSSSFQLLASSRIVRSDERVRSINLIQYLQRITMLSRIVDNRCDMIEVRSRCYR